MEVPAGISSAGTNDRAVLLPCWSNGNECSSPGWPRPFSGEVCMLDWRAHAPPSARSVTKQPIFRSRKQLIQWVETIFALQLSGHGNCHLGVKHLNDLPGCNGENHVFFALPRAYHKKQTERSLGPLRGENALEFSLAAGPIDRGTLRLAFRLNNHAIERCCRNIAAMDNADPTQREARVGTASPGSPAIGTHEDNAGCVAGC